MTSYFGLIFIVFLIGNVKASTVNTEVPDGNLTRIEVILIFTFVNAIVTLFLMKLGLRLILFLMDFYWSNIRAHTQ